MSDSFNQTNLKDLADLADQLVPTSNVTESFEPTCFKINLSKYSLDKYKTFNPDAYKFLCHLGKASDGFTYFPKTSRIVFDTNQQIKFVNNFEQMVSNIAEDFGITRQAAYEKSVDFFWDKKVTVQPTGLQGKFFKFVNYAQNYASMAYTSEAVSVLKTTGMTGFQIISKAPLTFVGATYIGALFFGYFGSVVGDNSVGLIFNSTSYVLSRPMRGVEITINGLILRPISNVIGLPLILNGTQELLAGKGLSVQEYAKIGIAFEKISNSAIVAKGKKIYGIIFDKAK